MKEPKPHQRSGGSNKQTYSRRLRETPAQARPGRVSDVGVMHAVPPRSFGSAAASPTSGTPLLDPNRTHTFRHFLNGVLYEFLSDEKMHCEHTQDGLVEAVVALAKYHEEGVPLYPKIVICDDLQTAMAIVGGSEPTEIGHGARAGKTIRKAIKTTAPLLGDRWLTYVLRTENKFRFGVFRQSPSPLAFSVRDTINSYFVTGRAIGTPTLFVTQLAENVVELVGTKAKPLVIHLNSSPQDQPSPSRDIELLAQAAAARVEPEARADCILYLRALFVDALRHGHGALIAVSRLDPKKTAKLIRDGVPLPSPIKIGEAVRDYKADQSGVNAARLLDYRSLVDGMLASDGITVFNQEASVTHFRVFVDLPEVKQQQPTEEERGGRHRAFEKLTELVRDKMLAAAYIRSSDGNSHLVGGSR